jgi:catechol 2,3-dioxygenase-like lactoylglutathione lyase family enzyme
MNLQGINHIAFLTVDLGRLCRFYDELFGARTVVELPIPQPEGPGRHALISVGGGATLHAFEFANIPTPPARPMFERGRIDHFALNVADAATFERLRSVMLERGISDGIVTDFGVMRVVSFTDPDGHTLELAHWVGGDDPSHIDPTKATDAERTAQRAASGPSA